MTRLLRLTRPAGLAALISLGWALMAACYLLISPPGSSSDEGAHLVRAVAVAGGDVVGQPPRHRPLLPPPTPRGWDWLAQTSRAQQVPAWFDRAPLFECYVPGYAPASCTSRPGVGPPAGARRVDGRIDTWVGSYPPYAYALLGSLTPGAGSPGAALYLGRLTVLGLTTLMAFAAVRLVAEAAPAALAWVALGVSSSALYYFGQLNPSGLEIAAGLLVWACLLHARAGPAGSGAGTGGGAGLGANTVTVLFAAGACVLVLSRELGLVWLALALAVLPPPAGFLRRAAGSRVGRGAAAALVTSCLAALVWSLARAPQPDLTGVGLGPPSVATWQRMLHQYAGAFAFSELTVPVASFALWMVGLLALLLLGGARRPGRLPLLRMLIAAELALWAAQVPTFAAGFGPVARYVMPVLVGVFVVGGYHATALPAPVARRAGRATLVATVVVHVAGVLTVAHRYGHGGPGLGWPASSWTWSPAGGYPLALGIFAIGLLAVATGVWLAGAAARGPNGRPTRGRLRPSD